MKSRVLLVTIHGGTGSRNVSGVYVLRGNVEREVGKLIRQLQPTFDRMDEEIIEWVLLD